MLITIFFIVALIFSAILHEYAHGWVAYKLGDNTAKDAGRLTLNPIAHIDPIGSVLLPLMLILSSSRFFIAWAKPVPYNPYNLRDQKYGDLKVALGGPGTNLAIALFFGLLARAMPLAAELKYQLAISLISGDNSNLLSLMHGSLATAIFVLASIICFVNLMLMLFNLVPIPPLDGSKVLYTFLPYRWQTMWHQFESYSFIVLLVLVYLGVFSFILPVILYIFSSIIGL
jgi:Zn-dependent protease